MQLEISNLRSKVFKPLLVVYIILYIVGIFGLSNPTTYQLFAKTISFVLLLTFFGAFFFHSFRPNLTKSLIIFSVIYLFSLAIEIIGVNYGIPFGKYHYGNSLGFKVFSTPLIIGLNWLFVAYSTSSIFFDSKLKPIFKVLLPSILMVIYDILLEFNAPKLNMWYFENNEPPLQNYIAWFFLAIIIHSAFSYFKINTKNRFASFLFIVQFLFHLILAIAEIGND